VLPELEPGSDSYRTPRLGDGFRTRLFGEEVIVPARDPRYVSAWKLGAQFEAPAPTGRPVLPAGALYLWRHPDDRHPYRAEIAGVYNNVFWSLKPEHWGNFEFGFTFKNFTLPEAWNEAYDGVTDKAQQIYWRFVRPGFTLGCRRSLENGRQDNMSQINWVFEPGYFYSGRSSETAADTVLPRSTFELRTEGCRSWTVSGTVWSPGCMARWDTTWTGSTVSGWAAGPIRWGWNTAPRPCRSCPARRSGSSIPNIT
jgi:hypothetical protein